MFYITIYNNCNFEKETELNFKPIENKISYKASLVQKSRLKLAIENAKESDDMGLHPQIKEAQIALLKSWLLDLQTEIDDYEERNGLNG